MVLLLCGSVMIMVSCYTIYICLRSSIAHLIMSHRPYPWQIGQQAVWCSVQHWRQGAPTEEAISWISFGSGSGIGNGPTLTAESGMKQTSASLNSVWSHLLKSNHEKPIPAKQNKQWANKSNISRQFSFSPRAVDAFDLSNLQKRCLSETLQWPSQCCTRIPSQWLAVSHATLQHKSGPQRCIHLQCPPTAHGPSTVPWQCESAKAGGVQNVVSLPIKCQHVEP